MPGSGIGFAQHFMQMRAHGIKPVMAGQAFILFQYLQLFQSARGALHHGHSHGMIQIHHGAGSNPLQ